MQTTLRPHASAKLFTTPKLVAEHSGKCKFTGASEFLNHVFSQEPDDFRNGLVTNGVSLTPEAVICAYRHGVFPWGPNHLLDTVNWHHPPQRGVLLLPKVCISRTDRAFIAAARHNPSLRITVDEDFAGVIGACAAMPRQRKLKITRNESGAEERVPETT